MEEQKEKTFKPNNDLASHNKSQVAQKLPQSQKQANHKYSFLSVFLAFIFLLVMILLGERLIFDLNRFLNPAIDREYSPSQYQYNNRGYNDYSGRRSFEVDSPRVPFSQSQKMRSDYFAIGNTRIYYKENDKGRYMMYKLIIHSAVIIPLFLFSFVLFHLKKNERKYKPILISFFLFSFWMFFHLLGELTRFVMDEYKNVAIYVILVVMAVLVGFLAYYSQDKFDKNGVGQK